MNRVLYLFVCSFVFHVYAVSGENCDKYGVRLYEDMACKPVNTGEPCPTSYDCQLTSGKNQCMVRGKIYNQGDPIPRDSSGHTCEFGCVCGRPTVNCPAWGCGDWAGYPPVPEGCHREYTLDSCCSTGVICPPFNDTTTCKVDGVEYKAGEKFFPKDSCYACMCQKGFTGKFEAPFCKRSGCDAQVKEQDEIQKSCAAVFKESDGEARCCPTAWNCPDGTEVIQSSGKSSSTVCKFGDKTLQIGDYFEKEIQVPLKTKFKCECKIPPLVMCFEA